MTQPAAAYEPLDLPEQYVSLAEYERWKQALTRLGVPERYVSRVATAARRVRVRPTS